MLSSPSSVLVACTLQHGWPLKVFLLALSTSSIISHSVRTILCCTVSFDRSSVVNRLFIWCVANAILFLGLQKKPEDINRRSADMWSFAVLLWELVTREVPFADLSHMEIGMKVSWHKY